MRLCRCGEEPGGGQREGPEAWMERERRGPSRSGPRADPQNKCRPPGSEAGEPRGARGAGSADKEAGASAGPTTPLLPPRPSQEKEGNLRAKGDGLLLVFLQTAGREVLALRGFSVPCRRLADPVAPDSTPRPTPSSGSRPSATLPGGNCAAAPGPREACAPRRPRCGRASPRGRGPGGRARGAARGGGGAAGTRVAAAGVGGDSAPGALRRCGGGRALSQAWPRGVAQRRRRQRRRTEAAADALSASASRVPLSRGPKKLCEPRSPAELPGGAPLQSPLCSRPPPSRLPSAWLLRPGASQTE